MDISTILGVIIGFGMIITGFLLEKGILSSLFLISPAVIVFGGTIGAVMLSFTMKDISRVPKLFLSVCKLPKNNINALIDYLVMLSETSKREGLLSLEKVLEADQLKGKVDPFLKRGTLMVIDGTDLHGIQDLLETEIYLYEQKTKIDISIFEAAGGYSPTMGIIGTVLGLIQVLSTNMSAPEELVKGIAVAFIATLYGVAFANLLYLPIGNKLKIKLKYYKLEKGMIIDGICSIRNGENPKLVRERLSTYMMFESKGAKTKDKGAKSKADGVKSKAKGSEINAKA